MQSFVDFCLCINKWNVYKTCKIICFLEKCFDNDLNITYNSNIYKVRND